MKLKILSVLAILFVITSSLKASDTTEVKKPKAEFSGFFRFDYWYDSRQNVDGLDGLLLFYPKPPELDANRQDINAAPMLNGLAMGTRLRANITMPKILNAKAFGLVEVDFTGTNGAMVHTRFRHAYTRFVWDSGTELNIGLTWHPMFVVEVFPYVASLNTGAPFQSFNRSPQITLKQQVLPNLKLILSALTQSDYKDYGHQGYSTVYLRQGIVPNLHAQLQYNVKAVTAGIAVDFKSIRPKLFTSSLLPIEPGEVPLKYVTNERLNGLSGMAYLKIQSGKFTAKAKGMYGQNLADHLMLGGYAVSTVDSVTGKETYTSLNHLFAHVNITYGKSFMPGIFVGYAQNLGSSKDIAGPIYGRGTNIDHAYRISPNFTYRKNNFAIMAELEHTFAATGKNDISNKGIVTDAKNAANNRILLMLQYDF